MCRPVRFLIAILFSIGAQAASALQVLPLLLPITGNVAQPSITAAPGGGFILTWQQRESATTSLHFATLDSDGVLQRQGRIAQSEPTQTWFVNWADFPALVVLDNGDWVTYWLQKRSKGTYAYDIYLTRSTDAGRTWSDAIIPHRDATASEHGFVSLVPAGDDRVLAIWLDGRNTAGAGHDHAASGGAMTLRSATINRSGKITAESEIDARTCDCCSTDAARIGAETLLIYRDRSGEEIRDMAFSRRNRAGRWSAPAIVHADRWKISGCPVNGPALAVNDGRALAVWTTMQGEDLSVRAALGNARGFADMVELDHGSGTLGRVDAAPWGISAFLVSWVAQGPVADDHRIESPKTEVTRIHLDVIDRRAKISERAILATLPKASNPGMPRIAASGRIAIAVWTQSIERNTTIHAALIRH